MSNWHNDNWSGNDSGYTYPVESVPRPVRRAIRFSFRFYLLIVCIGAFLWATYAGVQAIRRASTATQPATAVHPRPAHSKKGQHP